MYICTILQQSLDKDICWMTKNSVNVLMYTHDTPPAHGRPVTDVWSLTQQPVHLTVSLRLFVGEREGKSRGETTEGLPVIRFQIVSVRVSWVGLVVWRELFLFSKKWSWNLRAIFKKWFFLMFWNPGWVLNITSREQNFGRVSQNVSTPCSLQAYLMLGSILFFTN